MDGRNPIDAERGTPATSVAAAPAVDERASGRIGIVWMVLTTLLFVSQDACTRVLLQSYPLMEVAWGRYAVHMLVAAVFVGWRMPHLMRSRRLPLQLVRSTLLLAITLLASTAFGMLPFVDVTAILTLTPVLITALSVPLLGETVGWRRWLGVLAGLCGAMLIVGPASGAFHWAVALPLGAVVANALYQIVTRMLSTSDRQPTTFFYTSLVGTLVCTVALPFVWVTPDAAGWALMILLGALGAGSHFCLIRAFTAAPAATVAPFGYTTLIWANLFGIVAFGELPSAATLTGAAVIVASGIYIFYREQVRRPR